MKLSWSWTQISFPLFRRAIYSACLFPYCISPLSQSLRLSGIEVKISAISAKGFKMFNSSNKYRRTLMAFTPLNQNEHMNSLEFLLLTSFQQSTLHSLGHIELMKKYFRTLNMSSYDLPQVLKDRGVDDPEKLPHFYYRDDALKLWDAIKDFVSKMLSIYYQSDEDIEKVMSKWLKDRSCNYGISKRLRARRTHQIENLSYPRQDQWWISPGKGLRNITVFTAVGLNFHNFHEHWYEKLF